MHGFVGLWCLRGRWFETNNFYLRSLADRYRVPFEKQISTICSVFQVVEAFLPSKTDRRNKNV